MYMKHLDLAAGRGKARSKPKGHCGLRCAKCEQAISAPVAARTKRPRPPPSPQSSRTHGLHSFSQAQVETATHGPGCDVRGHTTLAIHRPGAGRRFATGRLSQVPTRRTGNNFHA
jgi:hypothetical protein